MTQNGQPLVKRSQAHVHPSVLDKDTKPYISHTGLVQESYSSLSLSYLGLPDKSIKSLKMLK